jgi:hypothetical protein
MIQPEVTLRLTSTQHEVLREALFPGDGKESIAVALCGRRAGSRRHRLTVHRVVTIPDARCVRTAESVTWPSGDVLPSVLDEAARKGLAVLKVHSHPTGYPDFSPIDDAADQALFPSVSAWTGGSVDASAVMLPDGRVFGRAHHADGSLSRLESVCVVGDDITFWDEPSRTRVDEHAIRNVQAFGRGTIGLLNGLSVAVVGCSGTGSFVVEQLARVGVRHLILVDPDVVEYKNLNRMLNAKSTDAALRSPKVLVLARAVAEMGLGTEVLPIHSDLAAPDAVRAVAEADFVFGCMDSVDGRHLLNRLAATYLLPFIDVGVKLIADGKGGVDEIVGTVHYVRPDGSSLQDRGVYTQRALEAASLRKGDPGEYARRVKEGYIAGANEDSPAVVSVNGFYASLGVNEMLARIHKYRWQPNREFAAYRYSLVRAEQYLDAESGLASLPFRSSIGRGDRVPLLDLPELSERG